eukprot:536757-Amphidinium_carterae.3
MDVGSGPKALLQVPLDWPPPPPPPLTLPCAHSGDRATSLATNTEIHKFAVSMKVGSPLANSWHVPSSTLDMCSSLMGQLDWRNFYMNHCLIDTLEFAAFKQSNVCL